MSKGKCQPQWDIYESVVLLDQYLKYRQNIISRRDAIRQISENLRQMAKNRGIEIDETYRNENGIFQMMRRMDSAYQGKTIIVSASKFFIETVSLYRSDNESYQRILNDAKRIIHGETIQHFETTPQSSKEIVLSSPEKTLHSVKKNNEWLITIDHESIWDYLDIMAKRQPPWDIYESVVLLDQYLKYRQNIISRTQAIRNTSEGLRQMAINRGVEIDCIYRNIIGITHMFYRIDSAYQGKTIVEPASKNLIDTVAFYRTEFEKYQQTLNDAHRMIHGESPQSLLKNDNHAPKTAPCGSPSTENIVNDAECLDFFDGDINHFLEWIDIMAKHPPLDRYEAAILLEGYFDIQKKLQPRAMLIKRISDDLRQLGRYRGIDVDDVYRNTNGVSFLLSMIHTAYTGKGALPPSKTIMQTVDFYRNDPDTYQSILKDAKMMISKQNHPLSNKGENIDMSEDKTDSDKQNLTDNLSDDRFIYTTDPIFLEFLEIMAKNQPPWDIYETSILLEGYLRIRQNVASRSQTIKEVSENLRKMGQNRGVAVDDVYRNTSGISYQLQRMDSAIKGRTVFVPTSKCFSETVDLYRNNPDAFQNILNDAKRMIQGEAIQTSFDSEKFSSELSENLITGDCDTMTTIHQPPWEIYEVVYLETTFFNLKQQGISVYRILNQLVLDLQKMGIARGIPVDNTYRNREEVFQKVKSYLELCQGKPKHPIDPVIKDAFQLKYHDHDAYLRALDHAKQLIENASAVDSMKTVENNIQSEDNTLSPKNVDSQTEESIAPTPDDRDKDNSSNANTPAAPTRQLTHLGVVLPDDINRLLLQKLDVALASLQDFVQCAESAFSQNTSNTTNTTETILYPNLSDDIRNILKQYYSGGFLYTSFRMMRLFRAKAEELNISLPEDDEVLRQKISSVGTIIDEKIYVPDEAMLSELKQWMENIFRNYHVAYFEPLYREHTDWLKQHNILKEDVLRVFLTQTSLDGAFGDQYVIKGQNASLQTAIADDIKNVWGAEPLESVESLSSRLIYIPEEEIRKTLNDHDDFLHIYASTYVYLDRFIITPEEQQRIFDYIESACERDGYALVSELPVDSIAETNDQLKTIYILAILLKKILLPPKYFVKQRIITKNYVDAPVSQLQKNYLRDKDSCHFDDLFDYTHEIIGEHNRFHMQQWTFKALYDNMVRTDERDYISDKYVHFDIKAVDHILSSYIPDHFIALTEIPTFVEFPNCGITWNHYVLGSFCYRYSDKYKLYLYNRTFKFNNIGIIAEKIFKRSYDEMIALALARSSLTDLSPQSCKSFLGDNGYTSGDNTIDEKTMIKYAQNAEQLRRN